MNKNVFDGFTVNVFLDEDGDYLAYFVEMPNVSAFSDTPEDALKELAMAWEGVKETGLTQTLFGKKASASDSASETVKREVAEARGPRRTDACCVSPKRVIKNIMNRSHKPLREQGTLLPNRVLSCRVIPIYSKTHN